MGFTLDAGANVHLLYPSAEAEQVDDIVVSDLMPLCENGNMIRDRTGEGPEKK